MLHPRWFRVFLVAAALTLVTPAFAADAQGFVKSKQTELTELVRKAKTPDEDRKVEAAFDQVLDYDVLARESLKEFWDERKPEERAEFQDALRKLVRGAYRKSLKRIVDYNVEYTGTTQGAAGEVVHTVAKSRTNPREEPVNIDYVVHESGGKWRIVDIVTEGSSLVTNYRNQFRRIIKKQGFPELIRRMKAKLDKGDVS